MSETTTHDHGDDDWRHCPRCAASLPSARPPRCPTCGWRGFIDPPVATVAVIVADGRVLLGRRGPDVVASGRWGLPGGFVDRGEHPEETLAREVAEETGLSVVDATLLDVDLDRTDPAKPVVTIAYAVTTTGDPRPADDLVELRWHPIDELPRLAFDADEARIVAAQSSGTSQPGSGGG